MNIYVSTSEYIIISSNNYIRLNIDGARIIDMFLFIA